MKKITLGFMLMFTMILAACGSESAQDVYQKAMEAGEKMESAELSMQMSQTMEAEGMPGVISMDMDTDSSIVLDPMAMHQTGTMTMEMGDMPIETEMEMYMTENDFYMYESMSDTWVKLGEDLMPTELMNVDQNPQQQLEMLESFVDEIEFTEEEDHYIFKYDGDGEELFELSQEIIKENFEGDMFAELGVDMNDLLENMTVHSMFYEVHIDKETYDTTNIITKMDFDMSMEGETVRIQQDINGTYTGINTIDKIEVPQEVIDSAEEM